MLVDIKALKKRIAMIFNVKDSLPGFEHIKTVELIKIDDFFMKLKSKEENDLTSFTLLNPFLIREYEFEIPPYYKELLEINENSNILILNIMIVQKPIENSTVNFIAPLIFNVDNKTMTQLLLDNAKYPHFGILEKISKYIKKD